MPALGQEQQRELFEFIRKHDTDEQSSKSAAVEIARLAVRAEFAEKYIEDNTARLETLETEVRSINKHINSLVTSLEAVASSVKQFNTVIKWVAIALSGGVIAYFQRNHIDKWLDMLFNTV